jgi:CheY-like chemotaxis protein
MAEPALMRSILIVDDEPVIRALAEESLRRDWVVRTAADANIAIAAIKESAPDLIFLDIRLPGVSGAELARRLRSDRGTAAIPIVYLTGVEPEDCAEADGVVVKPFTPERLRAYASNWL